MPHANGTPRTGMLLFTIQIFFCNATYYSIIVSCSQNAVSISGNKSNEAGKVHTQAISGKYVHFPRIISLIYASRHAFLSWKRTKTAPDPAGRHYDVFLGLLVGLGGDTSFPLPPRRHVPLDGFGLSILEHCFLSPTTQIPDYATTCYAPPSKALHTSVSITYYSYFISRSNRSM